LDAKVLPEPKLIFDRNESASINNGLWDLRNKKFAKPAGLRAFAVVDFSSGGRSMPYVKNLLQVVDRSSWFHSIEGSPKRNLKKFYENVTPTSKSFSRRITCSGSPIFRVSVVGKKLRLMDLAVAIAVLNAGNSPTFIVRIVTFGFVDLTSVVVMKKEGALLSVSVTPRKYTDLRHAGWIGMKVVYK